MMGQRRIAVPRTRVTPADVLIVDRDTQRRLDFAPETCPPVSDRPDSAPRRAGRHTAAGAEVERGGGAEGTGGGHGVEIAQDVDVEEMGVVNEEDGRPRCWRGRGRSGRWALRWRRAQVFPNCGGLCDHRTSMPSPSEHSGTPTGALHALVLDLFTAEEFRRWLRFGPDADIVPELPGESVADAAVVDQALGVLVRRGRIDAAFFARMIDARERKSDAIILVAALWKVDLTQTVADPMADPIPTRGESDDPSDLKRRRDLVQLTRILKFLNFDVIRSLVESSPQRIHHEIFTFWEFFDRTWTAPEFHVYDTALKTLLSDIHDRWNTLVSFGQYYLPGSGDCYVWNNNHPYSTPEQEHAHHLLIKTGSELHEKLHRLATLIHERYLEIDLLAAKRESWDWYRHQLAVSPFKDT